MGGMTEDEYADNLRMLSGFKTVEEFHQYWDTIDLQRLKYSANVRIFRAGILPFWTVHRNVHGGQFSIRLQGSDEGKANVFERIMEMLIKHEFVDCAKLNGVCFGKRGEKQHIKMWTSTTDLGLRAITDQLHDVCEALCSRHMKITFISFKDLHNEKVSNIEAAAKDQTPVDEEEREAALKPIVKSTSAAASGTRPITGVPMPFVIALALTYLLGLLVNDAVFD